MTNPEYRDIMYKHSSRGASEKSRKHDGKADLVIAAKPGENKAQKTFLKKLKKVLDKSLKM